MRGTEFDIQCKRFCQALTCNHVMDYGFQIMYQDNTNKSNTVSNIFNRTAPISVHDGVYGYKSIVLKKITEEGLKDVIKNGSKSKETATITYKVTQSRLVDRY